MRKLSVCLLSAALLCALSLPVFGAGIENESTAADPARATVTVSASSSVMVTPDKATVSFGVTTQEETAAAAQSKNSEAVNKVIEALTARGVEEKSIRTEGYSMYPDYDYSESGDQKIIGYTVRTSLCIEDQEIGQLGELFADCVAAGINSVDNVSFLCSSYDEAYEQALTDAVAAARSKALVLAGAEGRELGEAVSITEGMQDTWARYDKSSAMSFAVEESMDEAIPSFQPGESEISASVTISYLLGE